MRRRVMNLWSGRGVGVAALRLALIVVTSSSIAATSSDDERVSCTFPRQWRGRYFQSGLGDVYIRDRAITTKGHCVEHNRDYFLLHNRSLPFTVHLMT